MYTFEVCICIRPGFEEPWNKKTQNLLTPILGNHSQSLALPAAFPQSKHRYFIGLLVGQRFSNDRSRII